MLNRTSAQRQLCSKPMTSLTLGPNRSIALHQNGQSIDAPNSWRCVCFLFFKTVRTKVQLILTHDLLCSQPHTSDKMSSTKAAVMMAWRGVLDSSQTPTVPSKKHTLDSLTPGVFGAQLASSLVNAASKAKSNGSTMHSRHAWWPLFPFHNRKTHCNKRS